MKKTERIGIRLTKVERDYIEKAASVLGMNVSQYIVWKCTKKERSNAA